LEERIKKSKGKFKLLKVNIDKCGELATQLKIKSVPTVFFVYMGQGFDYFQGMVDDARLDKSFDTL
jgi:putative thioredoxin